MTNGIFIMTKSQHKRMYLVTLAITAVFFNLVTSYSRAQGLMDPLDEHEKHRTLNILREQTQEPTQSRPLARKSGESTKAITSLSNEKILLIERHQDKTVPHQRQISVYAYDYNKNRTTRYLINLNSGQLVSQEYLPKTQLPLIREEQDLVQQIIFSDPEQVELIQKEFKRLTKTELRNTNQLKLRSFIFIAHNSPEQLNKAAQNCGERRCAQVLLYLHDDTTVFEISPIIDISAATVIQNITF